MVLANPANVALIRGELELDVSYSRSHSDEHREPLTPILFRELTELELAGADLPATAHSIPGGERRCRVVTVAADGSTRLAEIRDYDTQDPTRISFVARVRITSDTQAVRVVEGRRVLFEAVRPQSPPVVEVLMLPRRKLLAVNVRGQTTPIQTSFAEARNRSQLGRQLPLQDSEPCWKFVDTEPLTMDEPTFNGELRLLDLFHHWTFRKADPAEP